MPDPLAAASDVVDIWRPLSTDETTRAENLIVKASAMLRAAAPFDIDARIALHGSEPTNPHALDPVLVASVVAEVVKRVMVNPEGVLSSTETVGPYSKGQTYTGQRDPTGDSEIRGRLLVLPSDVAALRATVRFTPGGTIRTRPRCDQPQRAWPTP